MSDSSTFSDTEQIENAPEPDRSVEVRAEAKLADAAEDVPSPDYASVPGSDANRGAGATFTSWSTAVAQLLQLQDFTDHELAGLGVTGAMARAFQHEDLTPRSFVEGIKAAVAFAPAEAEVKAEVAEDQAERSAAADAFADLPEVTVPLPSSPDLTEDPDADELDDAEVNANAAEQADEAEVPEDEAFSDLPAEVSAPDASEEDEDPEVL